MDVLLDTQGAPHLLEMNTNPSMVVLDEARESMPVDLMVKEAVMEGALGIVLDEPVEAVSHWEQVDLDMVGDFRVYEQLQAVYSAHSRKGEIPGAAFRRLVVASEMLSGAATIRADEAMA